MTSSPIDRPKGKSVRAWYGRQRRVIIVVAVGLFAIGAFLLWGPVGLGNGPLSAAFYGTQGAVHSGRGPVGFVIPIHNSGDSNAVVDGLDLIGGTSYPGPHVLGLEVLTSGLCGAAWPARQAAPGVRTRRLWRHVCRPGGRARVRPDSPGQPWIPRSC